jgi:RNA polymerase sigma-70 factor (ECF subfamily)
LADRFSPDDARAGDRGSAGERGDAFLALLAPNRDALYRFALRNAWRKDQAVDALQEAIMTAWRQFDRFERGSNFRAWMFKILLNTLYRVNRKTSRARETVLEAEPFEAGDAFEREAAWASVIEDPERVREVLDDHLVEAIDALGEAERQCLLLRLLEDLSYKEIASVLALPMGTVMSHVYRARMKLRDKLTELAIQQGFMKEPET